MATFKFGNFETEIDTSDFDFMQTFEARCMETAAEVGKVSQEGKRSETIKAISDIYFAFFDALFGEGTSERLFNGRVNMRLCDQAMSALGDAIIEDQKAYSDETMAIVSKYAGNRQTRRAKKAAK